MIVTNGPDELPVIKGDDFERGAQWLIALVRTDIAQTPAPVDVRRGLVAAGLLRTAELMEHSWLAHQNALHLPGQMLFRAMVDNWLVSRYLMEGPDDALDRVIKSYQGHRQRIAELTGLRQDPRIQGPPAGTKKMPPALQLAEVLDRADRLATSGEPAKGSARWWYGWAYAPMSDSAVHSGFGALERYISRTSEGFEFVARPDPLTDATRCFRLSMGTATDHLVRAYSYLGIDTSRIGELVGFRVRAPEA